MCEYTPGKTSSYQQACRGGAHLLGCHNVRVMLLPEVAHYLRHALIDLVGFKPPLQVSRNPLIPGAPE